MNSVYSDQSGTVSILVKIPENRTLKTSYFHLLEDGKVTTTAFAIKRFPDSEWRLALVVCVDTSGTMAGAPLEETKNALKELLSKNIFKSEDRIALISFENESRIIQWFEDQQKNLERIDALTWLKGQNTVLYDALYNSMEHLESLVVSSPVHRRILVISDGKDEGSKKSIKDVREKALALNISIDVVARVRKDRVKEDFQEGFVQKLNSLAAKTGGKFEYAEPGRVYDAMEKIFKGVMATSVVYFKRKIEASGSKTKKVGVQLQLPGEPSLSASIPAEIPRAKLSMWMWFLLLFLAFLVIILIELMRRRNLKETKELKPEDADIKPPPITTNETKTEPKRMTQIVGYYFPLPGPGRPTAILVGVRGPIEGQRFFVEKENFSIGWDQENDLCIPDDDYVSREHSYIRYERGSLFIFDKGSNNGTFVNQKKVTDIGFALNLGDRIRVGASIFDVVKAPS